MTSPQTYTNAGTYTIYYQVTAANYTTKTGSYKLIINQAQTATPGSCNSLTYNGSAQTLATGGSYVSYTDNSQTNA